MPRPPQPDEVKHCEYCKKLLVRKRYNGVLECHLAFHRRKYCDQVCMARAFVKSRVTKSMALRRAQKFKKDCCEKCGAKTKLNIHHINKDILDNTPTNLMTLCFACHTKWHWQNGKSMPRSHKFCTVCGEPARKLGMCQKHYQRFRKYGSPLTTKKKIGSQFVLVQELPSMPNGLIPQESPQESPKE